MDQRKSEPQTAEDNGPVEQQITGLLQLLWNNRKQQNAHEDGERCQRFTIQMAKSTQSKEKLHKREL